ncbi:MAG: hypothetical protein ACD_79C01288G0008 [uncultured bacterium]|nr:MAG: hypothetical protein ACD_79C01288G0008 [uncultured bacterium]
MIKNKKILQVFNLLICGLLLLANIPYSSANPLPLNISTSVFSVVKNNLPVSALKFQTSMQN